MKTEVTFSHGVLNGNGTTPTGPYMDLEAGIEGEYAGSFSGYVDRRVSKLIEAAPELLAALKQARAWTAAIGDDTDWKYDQLDKLDAAIAKSVV